MAGDRGRRDKGYGFSRTSLRRLVRLVLLRRLVLPVLLLLVRPVLLMRLVQPVPVATFRRRSAKTMSGAG